MSIEIHVFFRGKLPDTAALTRALKGLGFSLSITPPAYPLEGHSGYMPMRFQRDETGVEFYIDDGRAVVEDVLPPEQLANVDPNFDRCASFRWGSAEDEMVCGLCCAAALAKLTNGIVYEEQDGVLWSIDHSIDEAKKYFEEFVKKVDPTRGTRTADIKRYLKSLLKQRSDLVLVGRDLLIRPVRHFLRGAVLDRTSNKYCFSTYRYLLPLYEEFSHLSFSKELGGPDFVVWQPYFEPLLIERLKHEVFEQLGRVTTLTEFTDFAIAGRIIGGPSVLHSRITGLVLAGERDRAAEIVREVENGHGYDDDDRKRLRERWDLLSGDIETVCTEFHAKEAKLVKAMKLEHIWESSPFPVEVPAARRKPETSEIPFSVEPWIERPPTLLQELPENPGEILFARDTLQRNDRQMLLAPISREEAEERHRSLESYVLATRLPDDVVLVLKRRTNWDRNDPDSRQYRNGPHVDFVVELWGASLVAVAGASQDYDNKILLDFTSITIDRRHPRKEIWRCLYMHDDERTVIDSRSAEEVWSDEPVTAADRRLLTCPTPGFGEYTELVAHVRSLLKRVEHGALTENRAHRTLAQRFRTFFDGLLRS